MQNDNYTVTKGNPCSGNITETASSKLRERVTVWGSSSVLGFEAPSGIKSFTMLSSPDPPPSAATAFALAQVREILREPSNNVWGLQEAEEYFEESLGGFQNFDEVPEVALMSLNS